MMRIASLDRTKYTPPQLARLWGVSTAKIVGFVRRGELRAINVATSRENRPCYLIDVADIAAFEAGRQVIPDGGLSTTCKLRRLTSGNVKEFFK